MDASLDDGSRSHRGPPAASMLTGSRHPAYKLPFPDTEPRAAQPGLGEHAAMAQNCAPAPSPDDTRSD